MRIDDFNAVSPPEFLPVLVGNRVTLRPGIPEDAEILHAIVSEPSVMHWWGKPESHEKIAASLRGEDGDFLLVIEVDHAVVGGI